MYVTQYVGDDIVEGRPTDAAARVGGRVWPVYRGGVERGATEDRLSRLPWLSDGATGPRRRRRLRGPWWRHATHAGCLQQPRRFVSSVDWRLWYWSLSELSLPSVVWHCWFVHCIAGGKCPKPRSGRFRGIVLIRGESLGFEWVDQSVRAKCFSILSVRKSTTTSHIASKICTKIIRLHLFWPNRSLMTFPCRPYLELIGDTLSPYSNLMSSTFRSQRFWHLLFVLPVRQCHNYVIYVLARQSTRHVSWTAGKQ